MIAPERYSPLSVFRGLSIAVALVGLGCSEGKRAVSVAQPDGGGADVITLPQSDGGGADVITLPQPDGGSLAVPLMCQVPTTVAGPYSVTFRFRNRGNAPLFRYLGCTSELTIASCASSYSDQLANRVFCPCDCPGDFCPSCGACYDEGTELAANAIFEETWVAQVPVMSTTAGGRQCNDWKPLPAGRYRVRLPVYANATDAKAHAPTVAVATADFDLPVPAATGVIDIDIAP